MDFEEIMPVLKKIRFKQLRPELQHEVIEFAREMGYETTITSTTNLNFLFRLYQAERVKEKRSIKALKKAENLILKLSSLHLAIQERENQRRSEERKKKIPPLAMISGGLSVSKKTKDALGSIGITDEKVIGAAVGMFGEAKVEDRVEIVKMMALSKELTSKVFSQHPETILILKDNDFLDELDTIENKKAIIDAWEGSNYRSPPLWADYEKTPGILLDDYHEINRQLNLQVPEEPKEESMVLPKYVARPMKKRDMLATLGALGFEQNRKAKELVFNGPEGKVLTISDPHDREYDPVTIRKIIRDMEITPGEFEEARRRTTG